MPQQIKLMDSISHHVIDVERRQFEPGTLIYFRDNKTAFLAMADGKLMSLTELCDGTALRAEIADLKAQLAVFEQTRKAEQRYRENLLAKARDRREKALKR